MSLSATTKTGEPTCACELEVDPSAVWEIAVKLDFHEREQFAEAARELYEAAAEYAEECVA